MPAQPLRILQLNSLLTGGGTDDQCIKLALALHQAGQTVAIAGPDSRAFSPVIKNLGIPYHPTPAEGWLKLRFIRRAAKLIREHGFNVVHGHHGRDIWPTLLAARLSGRRPKVVITRHLAKSPGSFLSRRLLLRECDLLIAVSEFTKRVLCEGVDDPQSPERERHHRPKIYGDYSKIRAVLGGIDTDKFKPFEASELRSQWGLAPEHFAFAVAGGYDLPRGKGQREFLKAAALIHKQVPHARFLIIGRGSMESILRRDIDSLGLTGKAWLAPYCSDMPAAMNAIDCLVHPQIGTEAFALVVIEAFACAKPVIASDLDGIPEAFAAASYGQLVKPESVEELAEAMKTWAKRPRLPMNEIQTLHEKIQNLHSMKVFGGNTLKAYELFASNRS